MILFAGDETLPYRQFLLYAATGLLLYLIYQAIDFARIEYIVTGEQLVFKHGVLFHSSDYMELYRVVDYQENRSPMQQLTGLKSVTLLSGVDARSLQNRVAEHFTTAEIQCMIAETLEKRRVLTEFGGAPSLVLDGLLVSLRKREKK